MRRRSERHYLIDDVATVLRKPTAGPTLEPGEIIAIVLTTARWQPGRIIEAGHPLIGSVLDALNESGWEIAGASARTVIAAVLTATQWTPGRRFGPDDLVVAQILSSLKQMGCSFAPAGRELR
ncbi:hypothetical protein [Bradyrhizobium sp. SRS-191]|uniref:hypothetical protein n=1 Tax=Bradyrhizobium sp. SRS-191 TaxID=2962606 RepID=UPI00211E607C|nr:hypothetical protein [Bradyrhizobium sp. SRS-191]